MMSTTQTIQTTTPATDTDTVPSASPASPWTPGFDPAKAEAFMGRLVETLNGAALALMTSVGHRTGLFETLAVLPPATPAQIATEAALDERYVHEWLGAMATGGVVAYDPATDRYALPPEHAHYLTRAGGPDNLAVAAQFIGVLGGVEDRVVTCFHEGGGVPYEAYPRFHEVMAEESGQTVVSALVDVILPLAPGLTERLAAGIDVLDVGCGSGRALNLLARTFPRSRFTGYDLSAEAIASAASEAARNGTTNVRFEARDTTWLEEFDRYDLVTAFDAIHDQARPDTVLAAIARTLRPDGTFLMQEISGSGQLHRDVEHPMGPFLYTVSCLHCMTVSLSAGGAGLGAMWGAETARRMLEEAGFAKVELRTLPHDPLNFYFVARKRG